VIIFPLPLPRSTWNMTSLSLAYTCACICTYTTQQWSMAGKGADVVPYPEFSKEG